MSGIFWGVKFQAHVSFWGSQYEAPSSPAPPPPVNRYTASIPSPGLLTRVEENAMSFRDKCVPLKQSLMLIFFFLAKKSKIRVAHCTKPCSRQAVALL